MLWVADHPVGVRLLDGLAALVGPVVIFVACLGWHPHSYETDYGTTEPGDYDVWQVGLAVLLLGVLVAVLGHRRAIPAWITSLLVTASFTAAWSVDAASTETVDANLWPIGAAFLALGSIVGTTVVALVAAAVAVWGARPGLIAASESPLER